MGPTHMAPWPRPQLQGCALGVPYSHTPWLNTSRGREKRALQGAMWAEQDRTAVTLACVHGDLHLRHAPPDTCP